MALHTVGLVAVEEFLALGNRLRKVDVGGHVGHHDLGRGRRLPFLGDRRERFIDQKLPGLRQDPLRVVIKLEVGPHQGEFGLAANAQVFHIFDERVDLGFAEQRERRHRRAGDAVSQNSKEIGVGRLVGPLGALELEDARSVVTRIRLEERGGRPHAVARHAVTVGTMFTVKAVLAADDVAANRTAGQPKLGFVEAGLGQRNGFVRRAEHGQKNRRHLSFLFRRKPLLRGLDHVEAVGGWRSSATAGGQKASGCQQERDVRKPVHRSGLLSEKVVMNS